MAVGGDVDSDVSLNDYIRERLNLRGTKYMCKEGGCGACIVAVIDADIAGRRAFAVNSVSPRHFSVTIDLQPSLAHGALVAVLGVGDIMPRLANHHHRGAWRPPTRLPPVAAGTSRAQRHAVRLLLARLGHGHVRVSVSATSLPRRVLLIICSYSVSIKGLKLFTVYWSPATTT